MARWQVKLSYFILRLHACRLLNELSVAYVQNMTVGPASVPCRLAVFFYLSNAHNFGFPKLGSKKIQKVTVTPASFHTLSQNLIKSKFDKANLCKNTLSQNLIKSKFDKANTHNQTHTVKISTLKTNIECQILTKSKFGIVYQW